MSIKYKGKTISGPPGIGIPDGGNTGQILAKKTNDDFDTEWVDAPVVGTGDTTYLVNAPIGAIIVWSGTEDTVPQGWSICNGENGTLDLRDKFVLSAGTHEVGETGGSEEVKLTVEQMPSHTHSINTQVAGTATSVNYLLIQKGDNSSHTKLSNATGGSKPHPNMPPYYTALYIQKTGVTPTDYATEERVQEIVQDAVENIPTDGVTMEQVNQAIDTAVAGIETEEIYSTTETRIGTWIDGKPLYRRIYQCSGVETTNVETNILRLDSFLNVVDIHAIMTLKSGQKNLLPFVYDDGTIASFVIAQNNVVYMKTNKSSYTGSSLLIYVTYTKTTD